MSHDASRAWRRDHPWAKVYDAISAHDAVGRVLWRLGMGSDLGLLHRRAAAAMAALPDGAAVLDLPCGGGVAVRDVPPGRSLRYVAADISDAMLRRTAEVAARHGVPVETVTEDVGDLSFDDAEFDLVLAFTSLHCFPDPERAVHELARVLRPGGRLVASTMLRGDWRSAQAWVGGSLMGVLGPGCTAEQLRTWAGEAGLVDVELTRSGGITYVAAVSSA